MLDIFKRIRNLDFAWRLAWFIGFAIIYLVAFKLVAILVGWIVGGFLLWLIRLGGLGILALLTLPGRSD